MKFGQANPWAEKSSSPFTTFVVKVHERCNINCTYCYMYNLEDSSHLLRPKRMTKKARDDFFRVLVEHAEIHRLSDVIIVLHGGEPLLAGKAYLDEWISEAKRSFRDHFRPHFRLQTNAVLLDADWVELFHEHGVRLGISIDGPKNWNDKFRIDHKGNGTFDSTLAGLQKLIHHEVGDQVFGAVLSVANPEIPAKEMWEFWMNLGVTRFDFNLPHCNHSARPWFEIPLLSNWMIELFDLWWDKDDPNYEVRFFKNIVSLLLGSRFSTDYIGGKPGGIAVIETDGGIQGTDALRACEDGMIELGLNVSENSLDEALMRPLVAVANHSSSYLAKDCLTCGVRDVCGGGYLAHRYSKDRQFDNTSVYCVALYDLIGHARSRLYDEIQPLIEKSDVYHSQSKSTETLSLA